MNLTLPTMEDFEALATRLAQAEKRLARLEDSPIATRDLTVAEAATQLSMHPDHIRRLIRQDKIGFYQLEGGQYRIPQAAMEAYRDRTRRRSSPVADTTLRRVA